MKILLLTSGLEWLVLLLVVASSVAVGKAADVAVWNDDDAVSAELRMITPTVQSSTVDAFAVSSNQQRELRQSIFCRCVADTENFYDDRNRQRNRQRKLNKYYHYGEIKAGPKSVFDSGENDSDEQDSSNDSNSNPRQRQRNMMNAASGRTSAGMMSGSSSSSGRQGNGNGNRMMMSTSTSSSRVMSVLGSSSSSEEEDESDASNPRARQMQMMTARTMQRGSRTMMGRNMGGRNRGPMSVFGMSSAGRNDGDEDNDDNEYFIYTEPEPTVGADGFYIVDGITVLPLDDQACMVSQTNAALRTFLELFYRPKQKAKSRSEFWNLFSKGESMSRKNRDLGGWEERRKRARSMRRKKAQRDYENSLGDTDLSGGTFTSQGNGNDDDDDDQDDDEEFGEFVPSSIPRLFPCPNVLNVVAPSEAPTPEVVTKAPRGMAMKTSVPTPQPSIDIIASDRPSLVPVMLSDFPSLTPSTNIETLNPTPFPTTSFEPITTRRPSAMSMRMMRTTRPSVAPTPSSSPTPDPTRRAMSVLTPQPTRRPSAMMRMMRTASPTVSPAGFEPVPTFSPGPTIGADDGNTTTTAAPVDTPILPPVVGTPILPPVDTPLLPPVDTPLLPPVDTPLLPPVDTPLLPPVDTPALTPILQPVETPALFPFVSPFVSPILPPELSAAPVESAPGLFPFVSPFVSPILPPGLSPDLGGTPAPSAQFETTSPNATDAPGGNNATNAPNGTATNAPNGTATNAPNGTASTNAPTTVAGGGNTTNAPSTAIIGGNATNAPTATPGGGNATDVPGGGNFTNGTATTPAPTLAPTSFAPQSNITDTNARSESLDAPVPLKVTASAYFVNDRCQEAVVMESGDTSKHGSTVNATLAENSVEICGLDTKDNALGVWYTVVGTGATYTVDTCSPRTDFNTAIQVFVGQCDDDSSSSSSTLQCLADAASNSDPSCRSSRSASVTFDTVDGEFYSIYVFGRTPADVGTFGLSLKQV